MSNLETVAREELDELRQELRGLRRLLAGLPGANPQPQPAGGSPAGDGALLLAAEEQADALRRVERCLDALPDRIAAALEERFAVEEEPEEEGDGKGRKGKAKAGADDNPPADKPPRRYFPQRVDE